MSISALLGLMFVLLVVAAGAVILIRQVKAHGAAFLPLLIGFVAIGGIMIFLMTWRLNGESQRFELLATLKAEDVAQILVGDSRLESRHVPSVVEALSACRPLSDEGAHRQLRTGRTTLRIELNGSEGDEVINSIARYDPRRRAALLSFETWSGVGSSLGSSVGGDVQCSALPRALAAAGAALPES